MNNVTYRMTESGIPEFGITRENEERRDGGCAVVFDPKSQKYAVNKFESGLLGLFAGGIDKDEDKQTGVLREVEEESGLHDFSYVENMGEVLTHFRNSLKNVNRIATAICLLCILKSVDRKPTKLEAHETFTFGWASAEEILASWESRNQNQDYSHWIYFFRKAVSRAIELGYDKVTDRALVDSVSNG